MSIHYSCNMQLELVNGKFDCTAEFLYTPACRGGIDIEPTNESIEITDLYVNLCDENGLEITKNISFVIIECRESYLAIEELILDNKEKWEWL